MLTDGEFAQMPTIMYPSGPVTDKVTIDTAFLPPNEIKVLCVTDTSITLAWDHDMPDRSIKMTFYSVECWMIDRQEDSVPIQRITTNKEVTIESLIPDNVYCIQVRAVISKEANGSTFYGPSCPMFKLKTEPTERLAQIVRRTKSKLLSEQSGIDTYGLLLRKPQGTPTRVGVDHYIFGELSYSALAGKRRTRTILVVGATGSGKTTLINAMVNYVLGVEWEDDFRFKLIEELSGKSQAHSQTDSVIAYDLYHMKGSRLDYSLTVVDTPGFGDTQGIEKDRKIRDQIQDYFHSRHGVQQLEAVCFVVPSHLARLTKTQQYIFDSILAIFGSDIADNIRIMVTFGDNGTPSVLAAINEAGIPTPMDQNTGILLHHKFNSLIFFTGKRKDAQTEEFNRYYFDMSFDSFNRFFADLSRMETKSLAMTREVLDERKKLQALVQGFQMRTEIILIRLIELEKIINIFMLNKGLVEADRDIEYDVVLFVPKLVDISGTGQFTTNCENCQMTCHFPCRQAEEKKKHKCSVMDKGRCRICNCQWNVHYHQKYRYEMVKERARKSLEATRKQYQEAAKDELTNRELLDRIRQEIVDDEKQLLQMMQATSQHIQQLDEIALLPHPIESTLAYIDLMIEAEKGDNRPGFEERLARLHKLRNNAKFREIILKLSHRPQAQRQRISVGQIESSAKDEEDRQGSTRENEQLVKLLHATQATGEQAGEQVLSIGSNDMKPHPVQRQSDYDLVDNFNQMAVTEERKYQDSE